MKSSRNNDPLRDNLSDADCRIRIAQIRERLMELSGGKAEFGAAPGLDLRTELAWMEHVLRFEESPKCTHAQLLIGDGISLPPPDVLSDQEVHEVLWQVIHGLHRHNTFLMCTDHLSDQALYALLWNDLLSETTVDMGSDPRSACHMDLTAGGSEQEIEAWLTYYADGAARADWALEFPDWPIPPRRKPPFDRDRHLPRPVGF